MTRFVPRYHNGLIQSVEGFNDHPGRRQVSIVALFNRAIKNLKTKGLTG